ncbi:CCR4-NOT transcription complex subunit 1-like isoform X2 [Ornithodoros turicata]
MNLDSLSFALSYISYSVASLTKKNFRASVQEISRLVALHGLEAERHLLRCLFSHVDFSGDGKSSGKDFHQTQYLIHEFASVVSKPNFVSILCFAIENPLHHQKSLRASGQLLVQISRVLRLSRVQEVVLGVALLHSSQADLRLCATQFVRHKLPELLRSYTDSDTSSTLEGGLQDCAPEVLHLLLVHLLHKNTEQFGIGSEQREAFFTNLRKDFPRDRVPVVLAPLLYSEDIDGLMERGRMEPSSNVSKAMDVSLVDLIQEMGYSFTGSVEDCCQNLVQMGLCEPGAAIVARTLAMMASTHSGLSEPLQGLGPSPWATPVGSGGDKESSGSVQSANVANTWNVDVFVQAVHDLVPDLNWKDVVGELDFVGFSVKERGGLKLLWHALTRGLSLSHESFPSDRLYRIWRNTESQLSLLHQILKNSDIVCLTDYKYRPVQVDILKALPEDDNRDIANWKSLDLIETLLGLSELVQYSPVQDLFKFPVQHCPDLLMLGLLQVTRPMQMLRQELLTTLVFVFLGNHPNSAIVLQAAWNVQTHGNVIRPLMMHAMADWYLRGGECEQVRLSRILDVAQDLKALSMLLNGNSFPLVIDLACLASRREYLKLDKWLNDKIYEHKEPFILACVNFLKRRCPQILGGIVKEENLPKSAQLPPETLATMLSCLQQYAANVSQELSETILTMVGNCSILLNKPRQPPPGVVKTPRGLEPAFSAASINPTPNAQPPQMDVLSNISSSMANLSLGPCSGGAGTGVGAGAAPSVFGSSFPTPGSPAKLFGAPNAVGTAPAVSAGPSVPTSSGFSSVAVPTLGAQLQGQFGSQLDVASILPEMNQPVSKEIEDEANSYFQRIYNHPPHPTLSIAEVLDMLKRFQESPIKSERDVFNCMIKNLFEEYRFFPQYPEKELIITAQLFGGIIEQSLVTYMALGLALRYVLDALRKPYGTKMYYFGTTALDRFKTRLKDYPQYCQHLASIAHFKDFPEHLKEYVDYGARSQEPPNRPQGPTLPHNLAALAQGLNSTAAPRIPPTVAPPVVPPASATVTKPTPVAGKPSIANATNIDTLLGATEKDDKLVNPPEPIQDKVAFIINNLSQINLTQKTEEFKEVLKEDFWPWFAQYMVMKRASIEPNFHTLYANFLDTLKINELSKLVLRETFRNIKVLLRSDKALANFSDRSLLKSLGHWLGMLTIAKNKPILQIDIDIKSLLIEAYHKGQQELLYVVPFVAKVLESCAKSKVFKPPNPWTMGIVNALAELHQEPELKLNLKFEIEVLCKALNLDINDLKPTVVLKDMDRLARLEPQLSPRHKADSPPPVAPVVVPPVPPPPVSGGGVPGGLAPGLPSSTQPGVPPPSISSQQQHAANFFLSSTYPAVLAAPSEEPVPPPPSGVMNPFPQPQFAYHDINVLSLSGLAQHIQINNQLPLFQAHPQLKQFVRTAIERAVQEWMIPVVERSLKIALTTCEQIVRKDFALDPEEPRLRIAAHHMVRSLTAGMAMITCRDPMLMTISNNLKAAFHAALRMQAANFPQKELLEQAMTVVAQENVELACCYIQKTAVEKAIPEIDKKLNAEYDVRKSARSEGRRYCDPVALTYQAERMPEQIRLKVGCVTTQQMAVYEEFARNIPGFQPISERDQHSLFIPKPMVRQPFGSGVDDMGHLYDKVIAELEQQVHSLMSTVAPSNPQVAALHVLHEAVLLARNSRDAVTALVLLQKTVESMAEGLSHPLGAEPEVALRFREAHLAVLKALAEGYGHPWAAKHVTRFLLELREEVRWNVDVVDPLLRSGLLVLSTFDLHLAQSMENGMNYLAVDFAKHLVRLYFSNGRHSDYNLSESDLVNTIETLVRLSAHTRQPSEGLSQMMDMLRGPGAGEYGSGMPGTSGPMSMMHSGITQAREYDDPPGLHEKTEGLLHDWVSMYNSPAAGKDSTKAFQIFVQQMNLQGILKTDDHITRFFRLSTEMCVEHCYRALLEQTPATATLVRTKCFTTLDAYVRLIALLVKLSGDANNPTTKVNLLNKVLGIVAGVLLHDHEARGLDFQQLPYHRMFIMLFLELSAPEPVLEAISFHVLMAFCNTLHVLQPCKAPAFAYAWLELVSHRVFLGRVLALTPQQKAWGMFAQLLNDLFKYLAPFLRNVDLEKPIQLLYKGTLRVLLVLLHDFPEFLCDYHYGFCDLIPANCIQMRNLILSAFPRHMRLPDPFTPNLKVEALPEITQAPRVLTNFASVIQPQSFKKDLDSYIKTRAPVTFLSELRSSLQATTEPGMRYNVPLMNALVLYVGTQAIAYIQSKGLTPSMSTITHSSHMDIFQNLAVDLDTEGRYLFLNAIANQLRYPNSHTHYFSCTLLYLFAEANTEAIQEQITRVLLERLIVNRPHPWGLLVTFIDLIKNPTFKFWNHEFVRCAPEIEKLFESVARSCMQQKAATEASTA